MTTATISYDNPFGAVGFRRRLSIFVLLIAIVGGGLRMMTVYRPLNHQLTNAWREADYVQIARNFDREGMNVLYPRIDWRGDTPGFVEMEFPLTPWLAAAGYRLFGYHEQYLRILSAAFSIGAMLVFWAIARDLLTPLTSIVAFALFSLNPLLIRLSGSMQPEPLMLFCMTLAAYHAIRFDRKGRIKSLILAALATALAGLAKAPGAMVGLLLAVVCLRRFGWRATVMPRLWIAALLAILPPLVWYRWVAGFWREYGNSLGLSNESHWLTLDILRSPHFLFGNIKSELLLVWTPIGFIFLIAALRKRGPIRLAAWWYFAACLFYLAAAGTSGDEWASYYHCLSIPAACLLMAAGAQAIRKGPRGFRWFAPIGVFAVLGLLIAATSIGVYRRDHDVELAQLRTCCISVAGLIPKDGKIVVRGGISVDEFDRPVAYNEPMLFAWLDRRGFNYPKDRLSPETLNRIAQRGGEYWIAREAEVEEISATSESALKRYLRCGACKCGGLIVFDLLPESNKEHFHAKASN